MKRWINLGLLAGAGMALLLAAGAAMAQTAPQVAPPAPPPPPAAADVPQRQDGPGMNGMRHGWGRHMPPFSRAAMFHVQRGDSRIDVRCAPNESMKACADAASGLFDKLPSPAP